MKKPETPNNVVRHPSSEQLGRDTFGRFRKLQKQAERNAALAWLGIMAYEFTTEELQSIRQYMCERDTELLQSIGKLPRTKARKANR